MPIYEFIPKKADRPGSEASTIRARCRVHAPNEERAREYLEAWSRTVRNTGSSFPQSSWLNTDGAECVASINVEAPFHHEGRIEFWQARDGVMVAGEALGDDPSNSKGGTWEPVNVDEFRQAGGGVEVAQSFDGWGNSWGGSWKRSGARDHAVSHPVDPKIGNDQLNVGHLSTASPQLGRPALSQPIAQQTVRRAIQRKEVLTYQASTLADYISDLIGADGIPPDERNAPPLAQLLGIPEDTAAELLMVLKELREELRKFNEALAKQKVEPSALAKFRDVALNSAAKTFGATLGVSAGGMIIVGVGTVLDGAGLVSWDRFIDFVKAVRG